MKVRHIEILAVRELAECSHVDCGEPVQLLVVRTDHLLPFCEKHGKGWVQEETGRWPVWFEPLGYIVKGGL